MRMPPLPTDFIHARACKLKCEKILTRPFDKTAKPSFFHTLIRSFQQLIQQIRITFFPLDLIFKRHQNHTAPEGIVSLTQTGKMIPCEQKFNEARF